MLLFQQTTTGNLFLTKENVQKIIELLKDVVIDNGVRVRILTSKYMQNEVERLTGKQKIMMMSKERERQKKQIDEYRGSVRIGKQGKFDIHLIDAIQD